MITICFVYFKSLTLANLEAALFSLRAQDFSNVKEIFVIDNNSDDLPENIESILNELSFPVPVILRSYKHGDPLKTHSWSTNAAVREATTPWVFFCRADYLLAHCTLQKFVSVLSNKPAEWNGFVTSRGCHLSVDISTCSEINWRIYGAQVLEPLGDVYDYTCIDTGVWLTRRAAFDNVGGLNERLTAWGHAQTHFQWKLHQTGVECHRLDDVLFFHPQHGGEKDLNLAGRQIVGEGLSLQEMWARYPGQKFY